VSVTVTEHRTHTCACPCGTRTAAAFPEHLATSPSSYGPHLRTLAVYLMVFQHIPVERTAGLVANVTGAQSPPDGCQLCWVRPLTWSLTA